MSEKLTMNERGTLTLPAKVRQRLGLKGGDVLELEERDGTLVLRPTFSMPVRYYSDAEVKAWTAADALTPEQQAKVKAWARRPKS